MSVILRQSLNSLSKYTDCFTDMSQCDTLLCAWNPGRRLPVCNSVFFLFAARIILSQYLCISSESSLVGQQVSPAHPLSSVVGSMALLDTKHINKCVHNPIAFHVQISTRSEAHSELNSFRKKSDCALIISGDSLEVGRKEFSMQALSAKGRLHGLHAPMGGARGKEILSTCVTTGGIQTWDFGNQTSDFGIQPGTLGFNPGTLGIKPRTLGIKPGTLGIKPGTLESMHSQKL